MRGSAQKNGSVFVPASGGQRARIVLIWLLVIGLAAAVVLTGLSRYGQRGSCRQGLPSRELLLVPEENPFDAPALMVTLLDVGQGDAILVRSPGGKTMLIDAGDAEAFDAVLAALRAYGITRIDVAVATHPHADHIGAMAAVLDRYAIGAFYTTDFPAATDVYEQMLRALMRNGCPVYKTDSQTEIPFDDDVRVEVLNPVAGQVYDAANDSSVVLRLSYGGTSILLTGDMEIASESVLLDAFGAQALRANVLKLGHHGSQSSSGEAFLDAVNPQYAIVSVGKDNDYGHPHKAVLDRLRMREIPLYRTDKDGVITVWMDGRTVMIVP